MDLSQLVVRTHYEMIILLHEMREWSKATSEIASFSAESYYSPLNVPRIQANKTQVIDLELQLFSHDFWCSNFNITPLLSIFSYTCFKYWAALKFLNHIRHHNNICLRRTICKLWWLWLAYVSVHIGRYFGLTKSREDDTWISRYTHNCQFHELLRIFIQPAVNIECLSICHRFSAKVINDKFQFWVFWLGRLIAAKLTPCQ